MADAEWTVGRVARRSGVNVSTLHFYEKKGLIRSWRSGGNQRRYKADVLRRIAVIKAAQKMGISLEEIRRALAALPDNRTPTTEDWARLSSDWQEELNRLQANVPPFTYEDVQRIITEDLGSPPAEFYETFDPEPLAAASTAQVHRATLHSGQKVIVKVQRPDIQQQMRADLGIMRGAVRIAERRSERVRNFDVSGMLEQFGQSALNELDYRGEAYNALHLEENLKEMRGVKVAKVYPTLSSSRVLTQEFVRGVKITDVEAIEAAGYNRRDLADAQLRSAIKQLMIDGFFHGDPHPGNVLVDLDTGVVTYIDLGMVGQITINQRVRP